MTRTFTYGYLSGVAGTILAMVIAYFIVLSGDRNQHKLYYDSFKSVPFPPAPSIPRIIIHPKGVEV